MFYSLIFNQEDAEPILVFDRSAPTRLFLVRYIIGSGGENSRLIFCSEITGYDYNQQITYPTQKGNLDGLQGVLETFVYGSVNSELLRVDVEDGKRYVKTVKAIISEDLVSRIITIYQYAW